MKKKFVPFPLPLSQEFIVQKRAFILSVMLSEEAAFRSTPIGMLDPSILRRMFDLYDAHFFSGYLRQELSFLTLSLSSRLTSSAGKFICTKGPFGRIKTAEIRMSGDFPARLTQGPFLLNGLTVSTPQEAFLIVFEHELCHALETVLYGKTGHSDRFMALANGLFAHTAIRHSLPTRKQEAASKGLLIGMQVDFPCEDQILTGIVTYIGKNATVMVPSSQGDYRDRQGTQYAKYRVPLSKLNPSQSDRH